MPGFSTFGATASHNAPAGIPITVAPTESGPSWAYPTKPPASNLVFQLKQVAEITKTCRHHVFAFLLAFAS